MDTSYPAVPFQPPFLLPFSNTEQAEGFGKQATAFEMLLICEHRSTLASAFIQEASNEMRLLMAFEMQLCRESLDAFKKAYRIGFRMAQQSIERKAAA